MANALGAFGGVRTLRIAGLLVAMMALSGCDSIKEILGITDDSGDSTVSAPAPTPAPTVAACDLSGELGEIWTRRGFTAAHKAAVEAAIKADSLVTKTIVAKAGKRLATDKTGFWNARAVRGGDAANMYAFVRDQFQDGTAKAVLVKQGNYTYVVFLGDGCCLKAVYRLEPAPKPKPRKKKPVAKKVSGKCPAQITVKVDGGEDCTGACAAVKAAAAARAAVNKCN